MWKLYLFVCIKENSSQVNFACLQDKEGFNITLVLSIKFKIKAWNNNE